MKAYHFLKDNMTSGEGNEPAWKVGEERDIGDDNLVLCVRGYHSSPTWLDALFYAPGAMACIVEVSKPTQKDDNKQVSRKRKLITAKDASRELRLFACDCAERALKRAKMEGERSWDAIRVARLYAEGKASDKELAAAKNAAWDAARDAAWGAAWDAARNAAWNAAWTATRNAEIKWQHKRLNHYMRELFK